MPTDPIEQMLEQFENFLGTDATRRARVAVVCRDTPEAGIMMGEILDILYGFSPNMSSDDFGTVTMLIAGVLYRRTRKEENL